MQEISTNSTDLPETDSFALALQTFHMTLHCMIYHDNVSPSSDSAAHTELDHKDLSNSPNSVLGFFCAVGMEQFTRTFDNDCIYPAYGQWQVMASVSASECV